MNNSTEAVTDVSNTNGSPIASFSLLRLVMSQSWNSVIELLLGALWQLSLRQLFSMLWHLSRPLSPTVTHPVFSPAAREGTRGSEHLGYNLESPQGCLDPASFNFTLFNCRFGFFSVRCWEMPGYPTCLLLIPLLVCFLLCFWSLSLQISSTFFSSSFLKLWHNDFSCSNYCWWPCVSFADIPCPSPFRSEALTVHFFLHQIFLLCFVLCPPLHFLVNSFWCCFSIFWAFPGLLSETALCLLHAGCLWRGYC